ncbi:MAG: endonuclease/exonuclease/phosphatase family protein [Nitrospiraceae bacterium]
MRIRLATYNIHHCTGWDGRDDPQRIFRVLQELDADVIALQEVSSHEQRGLELLQWLAEETKLRAVAGPTLIRQTGQYGNAILTRYEILKTRRLDLSLPHREPRGAIDVDMSCGGTELQLIVTHLGLLPAERRIQTQRLLERVNNQHCILMGDLNEWFLWGRTLRWIHGIFGHTPAPPTFPAFCPFFALDRIWIRPRAALIDLSVHKTPLASRASDHLPLRAEIEY